MSKYSFDEVTKEELLDSILELTEALEHAINYLPWDAYYMGISSYTACKRVLHEHGYEVYSETYYLPE